MKVGRRYYGDREREKRWIVQRWNCRHKTKNGWMRWLFTDTYMCHWVVEYNYNVLIILYTKINDWMYLCMYWIKRDVSDSGDDKKMLEIIIISDDHDETRKCLFITFSISSQRSNTLNLPHCEDDELFESFILELF